MPIYKVLYNKTVYIREQIYYSSQINWMYIIENKNSVTYAFHIYIQKYSNRIYNSVLKYAPQFIKHVI